MISRTSRRGIIALSLLLLLSLWATRKEQETDNSPIEGLDTRLDYALSNFVFHYFDEAGTPAVVMRSPRFISDTASGQGRAEEPNLEVRHEGFLWNIIADSATVTGDRELIHLGGDVQLHRQGETPDSWLTMNSSEVSLEVTPRIARSTQAVEMLDISGRLNATGFSVDMTKDVFQLNNDVRGKYVIE